MENESWVNRSWPLKHLMYFCIHTIAIKLHYLLASTTYCNKYVTFIIQSTYPTFSTNIHTCYTTDCIQLVKTDRGAEIKLFITQVINKKKSVFKSRQHSFWGSPSLPLFNYLFIFRISIENTLLCSVRNPRKMPW